MIRGLYKTITDLRVRREWRWRVFLKARDWLLAEQRFTWPTDHRVPSLDGLRAFSVTLVLLAHLTWDGTVPAFFSPYGKFGVHIFFVISGFIITQLLLKEKEQTGSISLSNFYKRRFFRIVPAAYLYLGVMAAVHAGPGFQWTKILWGALFVADFDLHRSGVGAHLWSLSVEEQFYFLWPTVLVLFFSRRLKILFWALLLAPFSTLVFYALHETAFIDAEVFPVVCDSLAIGCLGAVLYGRLSFLKSRWFLLAGPAAVLLQWPHWPHLQGHTLWPITHLCIGAFVVHSTHHKYLAFNARPITWIGNISYGIYLWHAAFLIPIHFPLAPLWTLVCACISYYLLEHPILAWRKRRASARHEAQSLNQLSSAFPGDRPGGL